MNEQSQGLELVDKGTGEIISRGGNQVSDTTIKVYEGASMLKLSDDEEKKLQEKVNTDDVEIRPDGLIYLPQVFFRDIMNKTFGRGQWALVQIKVSQIGDRLAFDGSLYIRGCFVARAMGEAEYHENNPQQSWATVYESAKSDCLTRCCKDLGIGKELWSPKYARAFQEKYCVKVWREKAKNGKGGFGAYQWRLKTSEKFYDEKGASKADEQAHQQENETRSEPVGKQPDKPPVASGETQAKTATVQSAEPDKSELAHGDYKIPFGIHKGKRVDALTDEQVKSTIKWCEEHKKYPDVVKVLKEYLADDGLGALNAPQSSKLPPASDNPAKVEEDKEFRSIASLIKGSIGLQAMELLSQRIENGYNDGRLGELSFKELVKQVNAKKEAIQKQLTEKKK